MKEDTVLKIITQDQDDFEKIANVLNRGYEVIATSKAKFDEETKKWHMFVRLVEKVKA